MAVDEPLMVMPSEAMGAGAGVAAVMVILARAVLAVQSIAVIEAFMVSCRSDQCRSLAKMLSSEWSWKWRVYRKIDIAGESLPLATYSPARLPLYLTQGDSPAPEASERVSEPAFGLRQAADIIATGHPLAPPLGPPCAKPYQVDTLLPATPDPSAFESSRKQTSRS